MGKSSRYKCLRSHSASVRFLALSFFIGGCVATAAQASGFDADAALKTFKKCKACHQVGTDAKNRVGPQLNGLENRPFAAIEDYKYSKAFRKAAEAGSVWNAQTLDEFLSKPKAYIKGTKMSFGGLKKDGERQNLIGWLLHFGTTGEELSSSADLANGDEELLGAAAAGLEGDPEYGQYLSGECVTCHKPNSTDENIPSIEGWPKEDFIHALYLYKTEVRENPVMQTVTKRLTDEEIAALAAYFGSLGKE